MHFIFVVLIDNKNIKKVKNKKIPTNLLPAVEM